MKKATGKVVSLVLALALVITSFSATFAFAATKTETGEATIDTNKDLYLANTNGVETPAPEAKYFNLTDYIFGDTVTLETYDHIIIQDDAGQDNIEISQVTVSGDNIVKVTKVTGNNAATYNADEDDYIVSVRNAKGTGSATLNVLLTAKSERGDDEITVRGSVQIDVTLLDAETPILVPDVPDDGKGPDDFGGLKKNYTKNDTVTDEDQKQRFVTTGTAQVVLPVATTSAIASYAPQILYSRGDSDDTYGTNEDVYVIAATGTRNYLEEVNDGSTDAITYGVMDPSVGNTVRLTAYSVKKSDDNKNMVVNKSVDSVTVRVENKVVGDVVSVDVGDGEDHDNVNGEFKETTLLSKSKTYAEMKDGSYWDVTGGVVDDDTDGLDIIAGRVGDVSADGEVTVNDGTVGNLVVSAGTITLDGGSLTSAKNEAADAGNGEGSILINGATVGEIKDATEVEITSGKVTGAVSADEVRLNPANDEEPVSVGAVSAQNLWIDGTIAAAAAGSFKMTSAGTITMIGKNASVSGIDFDYRDGDLVFQNFAGSVPAPVKASFTGYDATGAEITTSDVEDEDATNATVSGNLAIQDITLESGTVTFSGRVKVDNVNGGEATMVINAGALEIAESIGTSNTLRIADPADVVNGTVVYTATSEIADESSFIGYGFDMRLVSGSTTDALVIDDTYFSGLTMNVSSADILLGTSQTFTASAYPNGTSLPEGAYIKFFLDADESYITGVDNGNGTATIQALKYDSTFDVLNKGTLTAQVYDEYEIQLEEYGEATVDITVIEKPKTTYVSDTTSDVVVPVGNTYQFKITSTNGAVPNFAVAGNNAIFRVVEQNRTGNDYFFKVQAVGTPGQTVGVYINYEGTPVATLTVGANFTCDTTTVNVAVGASYIAKVTANEQPVVAAGNSSYTVELASQSGNDYFFRITAVSAQAGDQVGFYINSSAAPVFIATTV